MAETPTPVVPAAPAPEKTFESAPPVIPVERPKDPVTGKFVSNEVRINRAERARQGMKEYFASQQANRLNDLTGETARQAEQQKQAADAEAKADAPEAEPEPQEEVDADALAAGIASLKRLKVPAKLIDGMNKSDLAKLGEEAQKQVASSAELSRELGELRKAAKKSEPSKAASGKPEQPALDLEAELKRLSPVLDEEAVEVFGKITKAQKAENDSLRAELKALSEKFNAEIGPIKTDRTAQLVEKARAGLTERFPQISDEKFFTKKVLPRAALLNRPDEEGNRPYSDVNELLLHACRIEADEKQKSQSPTPTPRPKAPALVSDTTRARAKPLDTRAVARLAWNNRHKSEQEIAALVRNTAS